MNNKNKTKKKSLSKSRPVITSKNIFTRSYCKDTIIWELYKECLRYKKSKSVKDIKLYVQDVDYPISINYTEDAFKKLKDRNVIQDYTRVTEEQKLPPVNYRNYSEPFVEILPYASNKDLNNLTKNYETKEYSQIDYLYHIKCYPKKVIKQLEKEFKRIDKKRQTIIKRQDIERLFKLEQVLTCDGLRLGLSTGNAIYGETITNFKPDEQEYLVLKALMEKPNHRLSYEEINHVILSKAKSPNPSKKDRRGISFIIRDIRRKLGIIGPNKKNEDLFEAHNGYMIIRKSEK